MARRLRTTTGCDQCRRRRVKCDEERPKCRACRRLNLMCNISTRDASSALSHRADPTRIQEDGLLTRLPAVRAYQDSWLANGFCPFPSQAAFDFATFSPRLIVTMLSPAASAGARDMSPYLSLSLSELGIRDASIAFAARIMAFEKEDALPVAVDSYQHTIVRLRNVLGEPVDQSQILPTLVTMMFIGLYELFGEGDLDHAAFHFTAILTILGGHTNITVDLGVNTGMLPTYRFLAEMSLYAVAGTAIYQSRLDALDRIDWVLIRHLLSYSWCTDTTTKTSFSPLLHGQSEIFLVLVDTARLARQLRSADREVQARRLTSTLDEIEGRLRGCYNQEIDHDVRLIYQIRWRLLINVLRIYILAVLEPQICSAALKMQRLVAESLYLVISTVEAVGHRAITWEKPFSVRGIGVDFNPGIIWTWPILICSIHDAEHLDILRMRIVTLPQMMPPRYCASFTKLLDVVSARKAANHHSCGASIGGKCNAPVRHDGLDLLLHPKGVFGGP